MLLSCLLAAFAGISCNHRLYYEEKTLLSDKIARRQRSFRIVGLTYVQAALLAALSPVEAPVRSPLCAGLGIAAVLNFQMVRLAVRIHTEWAVLSR